MKKLRVSSMFMRTGSTKQDRHCGNWTTAHVIKQQQQQQQQWHLEFHQN
jgi:hypothetical protein